MAMFNLYIQHMLVFLLFMSPFYFITRIGIRKQCADLLPWTGLLSFVFCSWIFQLVSYSQQLNLYAIGGVWALFSLWVLVNGRRNLSLGAWPKLALACGLFILTVSWFFIASPWGRGGTMVGSLFPQHECDIVLGHMTMPMAHIANGGWTNAWWLRNPWTPELVHSLFSVFSLLMQKIIGRGDLAPALLQILFLFALVELAMAFLQRWALAFFALVFCVPMFLYLAAIAYQDVMAVVMYVSLACALWSYLRTKKTNFLYLSLFLCVASYCTKHQGGLFAAVLVFALLLVQWDEFKTLKKIFKDSRFWYMILGSGVLALTYLGKNIILAHNPLFPFGPYTENGYLWDAESVAALKSAVGSYKLKSFQEFLTIFSMIPGNKGRFADTGLFAVGPLWWVLWLPILIRVLWNKHQQFGQKRENLFLLFATVLYYFVWLYTSPVYRYLCPLVVFLVFVAVVTLKQIQGKLYQSVAVLIFVVAGFVSAKSISKFFKYADPAPITKEELMEFNRKNYPGFSVFEWLDKETPQGSIVLNVQWSCSSHYTPRPMFGDWFGVGGLHHFLNKPFPEISKKMTETGVDYVLLRILRADFNPQETFGEYLKCLAPEFENERVRIYKVKKDNPECVANVPEIPEVKGFRTQKGFSLTPFWE